MKFFAYLLTASLLVAPAFAQEKKPEAPAPAAVVASPAAAATSAAGAPASKPADAKPAAKPVAAKPDLGKGAAKYEQVCASCHGADGNSGTPANPKLAGQHPEYLVKQLQEFKSGFAATLSDDDMRNIAYWAASQKAKPGFAKDKVQVALGERIYKGGIQDRQIAACAGCHSPNGAGMPAQYPRLAGQHADYVTSSLISYREGGRTNSVQMTQVAAKLNDREIKAVSDYIAGLR